MQSWAISRVDTRVPLLPSGQRWQRLLAAGGLLAGLAVVSPVRVGVVSGGSMDPTLHNGQPFLFARQHPPLRRGDVVLIRLKGETCVKRIFALGGEPIRWYSLKQDGMASGRMISAGASLAQWRKRYPFFKVQESRVPQGQVFVLGDGNSSLDSRQVGPVPEADVIGWLVFPNTHSVAAANEQAVRCPPPLPVGRRARREADHGTATSL